MPSQHSDVSFRPGYRLLHHKRQRPTPTRPSVAKDKCPILDLPVEILTMIFGCLHDFETLASAAATCRSFHTSFQDNSQAIIRAIFANVCGRVRDNNIGEIFWQLEFAIRRCLIPRADVEAALGRSWSIFAEQELGELLLPLARALAWSYCIDDQEDAAIQLLTMVWDGTAPFHRARPNKGSATPRKPPSYLPIGSLLQDLVGEKRSIVEAMQRLVERASTMQPYAVRVNKLRVTLGKPGDPDTIAVYFAPGRRLRPSLQQRSLNHFRFHVAERDNQLATEEMRRQILLLERMTDLLG
ncbi:hypothetical protein EDB80DRAFT_874626 [Ilyonectria destructans]|nr:hypothetical protein EDB80DRAFT_874626 [Ilyonectria destructans]